MTIDTDIYTEEGEVRYLIGDTAEPYYLDSNAVVSRLLRYPTLSKNNRIYFAALDSLKYLLSKIALTGSSRKRHKAGGEEIEEYGGDKFKALKQLYDDLVSNPPDGVSLYSGVYFGGVSKEEKCRVNSDPDSIGIQLGLGWTYRCD